MAGYVSARQTGMLPYSGRYAVPAERTSADIVLKFGVGCQSQSNIGQVLEIQTLLAFISLAAVCLDSCTDPPRTDLRK